MITTPNAPLISRFVKVDAFASLFLILFGVAFIAALAQVKLYLPISPVPITGQTLAVLLIGASYGLVLGGLTLMSYLCLGIFGLPFFADGSSGWHVLTGSTGGYLIGFVLAACLIGYLAERGWDRSYLKTGLAMLLGNVLIYVPGLIWLRFFAPDWPTTLAWGLLPFVLGDILKALLAVLFLPSAWHLLSKALSKD